MASVGVVRVWHTDEGWGVLDAEDTPDGCWVHRSALRVEAPRHLSHGQAVEFEWEHVTDQDGHRHRATAAWLAGRRPVDPPTPTVEPTAVYRSHVTVDGEQWPPDVPDGRRHR